MALELYMPATQIGEIVHERRRITAETARRLAVLQDERRVLAEPAEFFARKGAARKTNTKTDTKAGRLEGVAGPGGFEVLDAVAEQALLGEFFGEDDLRGDEDGGLAGLIGDGDFDEGLRIIFCTAFEAQAALGHILALDDIIAALGMADASGVADFDARMLAAIDARRGGRMVWRGSGWVWGWRGHGEDGSGRRGGGVINEADGQVLDQVGSASAKVGWR